MKNLAVVMSAVVPAVTFGASGVWLLRTRGRLAGALMVITAIGVVASVAARLADEDVAAQVLLTGSLLLPGSLAVLAYPRPTGRHAFEFCLWVITAGAGVVATVLALDAELSDALITLAAIAVIALVAHGWWVIESGDEPDREAILWLGGAALTVGLLVTMLGLQFGIPGLAVGALPAAAVGPAMVVGILRPGVTDIRSLVVSVVVLAVVAVSYLSVFTAVGATFEALGVDKPSPVAFAFVGLVLAAGFHPLRVVLRGLVDELLFGDRPDPLTAATAVVDRVGDDPVLALRAIREALLLPYASLSTDGSELASSGTVVTETRRLPLLLGDDTMGEIVVGLRPGELTLSAEDEQVLRIVGPLLAQTLRSRALALDLRESRAAAISAIEEERRRLRRDLHDGLGPTLSGIAHTAAAARNSIVSDPDTADELLGRLRSDAATAVGEIRRLVYDMRPPALDELGLVAALRQQFRTTRTPAGHPMHVLVEADDLPPLPASVEVAAYRIATEAVTNSARHSRTHNARLELRCDGDRLVITVRDKGASTGAWVPGVGLSSMRERASEVGGTVDITSNGHGSEIRVLLPLS